jgi:receptor expression-enhancing protein 5/6
MLLNHGITSFATRSLLAFYGFQSWKAIENNAKESHWLTFWMLYAFFQAMESLLDMILFKVPLYYELKLFLFIYLGALNGAETVYDRFGKNAIKTAEAGVKQISEKPEVKKALDTFNEKAAPFLAQLGKDTKVAASKVEEVTKAASDATN